MTDNGTTETRQELLQELLVGPGEIPPEAVESAYSARFRLRQTFRYEYGQPIAALEQRLVVSLRDGHGGQRLHAHQISVIGADATSAWSYDEFGNAVADLRIRRVEQSVEFRLEAVVERGASVPVTLPADALQDSRNLQHTALTEPVPAMVVAAREAAAGLEPSLEMAARLSALTHARLAYRKGVTSVNTSAGEAFAGGAGVCQDHAHIMLAMCRALGLPARYVSGHLLGEGATHAWVEAILPHPTDAGLAVAEAFDPCHGRRPGLTYITTAVGRDYQDVAPTSGVYRGRTTNRLASKTYLEVLSLRR